ncbi:MAG: PQQ-binding-like beta-propeller repeat protein, partial [Phycisphaeraceae bacterium]|nr:PQQ-binding-like beta-propeller repeat protein [Phycisphaeraceae bacterium]
LGCGDGTLTGQLRVGDQYFVHGLDTSDEKVAAARAHIMERDMYGPVSVDTWDGRSLPYADNLVNLVVAETRENLSDAELLRVLAPGGVALVRRQGQWERISKGRPEAMDEWTHYLHGADGNPVADDSIVAPPERLQWIGSPRWSRHHDHAASMSALVSAAGRLFYILDEGPTFSIQLPSKWRLIARDAFNGVILWKRDIEQWNTQQYPLKSGPAHLLRRLVAVDDRVYVTLGIDAPVTALDSASGKTVLTYDGSEYTREIVVSQGVAFFVADTSKSRLPEWRRKDTYVWANTRRANPDWGWKGRSRRILAYDTQSGRSLWEAEAPVAPCSMAVDAKHVVFHDGEKLVCLDRANGERLWAGKASPTVLPVNTNTGPRVLLYKNVVLFGDNKGKMSGWSAQDGKKLWEQKKRPSGHQSLKDLFVVQGLAWTGDIAGSQSSGTFTGYDPFTGKVVKEFPADVKVHWFHHRCYPAKAAGKYLMTARNGTEFIDLTTEHWKPHHWVRGGCIYGVMPCNGMTYAPMDSCGCQMEAKITGFKALASGGLPEFSKASLATEARLERGPAYQTVQGPRALPTDWPTYRHDTSRSGSSSTDISANLNQRWERKLGGRLTAPTIAAGKLFVGSVDTHTLYALDAKTGQVIWSYTTGGRIDSPPTYFKGLALLGSADGYVYALRAKDGVLAWRFRAAPLDRRMMAWEQLESAWRVHGSVLVFDDVLYCTAGRNMYVDGGVRLIRLDPTTGILLGETVMNDMDPETGEDMHLAYLKKTQGNNMPVAHSDILSCDGKHLWMRSQKIALNGQRLEIGLQPVTQQEPEDFHIFCQNGFLDDSYFFRSYWTYGRRVTGGYGAWLKAGRLVPSGRILCTDEDRVYGFGRKPEYMVNASVLEHQLFAANKTVTQQAIDHIAKAERAMNERSNYKSASASDWRLRTFFPTKDLSAATFQWKLEQPSMIARAMTAAGDHLFVSGLPKLADERQAFHQWDDAQVQARLTRQAQAYAGKAGGQLWVMAKTDGRVVRRYALDTIPVFDGMAAAHDSLYMTTVDGRVLCLSGQGDASLQKIDETPIRDAWDQPEDPNYLLPLVVRKDSDFTKVVRCEVLASDLGYRVKAAGKKRVGIAVKKLAQPITGRVTFKTRLKAVPNNQDLLSNGYLVFGDGTVDGKLIKCGAQLRTQRATIVQGPLKTGQVQGAKVSVQGESGLDILVTVDLKTQEIVYQAGSVMIEARLQRPLRAITHIGYAVDSAVIDFAPIEISRR